MEEKDNKEKKINWWLLLIPDQLIIVIPILVFFPSVYGLYRISVGEALIGTIYLSAGIVLLVLLSIFLHLKKLARLIYMITITLSILLVFSYAFFIAT